MINNFTNVICIMRQIQNLKSIQFLSRVMDMYMKIHQLVKMMLRCSNRQLNETLWLEGVVITEFCFSQYFKMYFVIKRMMLVLVVKIIILISTRISGKKLERQLKEVAKGKRQTLSYVLSSILTYSNTRRLAFNRHLRN